MPCNLREFIIGSLDVLERQAPGFHDRLCQQLDERRVQVGGDGVPFTLCFEAGSVSLAAPDPTDDVVVQIDRAIVLALIDAEATLEDAVLDGRVRLRGSVDDLGDFHEGLLIYVRGGVRCPSFPQLVQKLRDSESAVMDEVHA